MRAIRRTFGWAVAALTLVASFALVLAWSDPAGVLLAATVGTTAGVDGNVNEAMKTIFQGPLTNSIVADSELLDIFEQDQNVQVNQTTGGRYIELAHYFSLPAGVGARALEDDYIPVPNGPVIRNSQIYLKKVEGVVQMSGDTMRRVRQGEGAFVTWARRHLPDLKERVDHELDRMLLGYGAGIRAQVNDADPDDGDNLVGIDNAVGITGLEDAWLQFMEQEFVVFGPNADGTSLRDGGDAYEVVDVDPDTGHIELDPEPTVNVADNDFIFGGDAAGFSGQDGGVDREIMGLLGMVDDGSILAEFQGLTRADYRPWRSQVFDNSLTIHAGDLTEDLLTYADDKTYVRAKGEIDTLCMSRTATRNFWANLKDDKRLIDPRSYVGGKMDPLRMLFGDRGVELREVRKMPPSLVFGLQTDTFKHWRNTGWEWDDLTGSIWNRVTDGTGRKDTFYAVGHIVLQTGCVAPHKNFKITDLDTSY